MELTQKFITPGIVFVLTVAFGFWLSHAGKPYNGILFNIHKLIALGAVIITGIQVAKMFKTADSRIFLVGLIVVAVICVIALFASGAMMSIGTAGYEITLTVHRIAPVVLAVALVLMAWLLWRPT